MNYHSNLLDEFSLINDYFKHGHQQRQDVILGIGDDAALVTGPPDQVLALSMDTLIAGVHFPIDTNPHDIGYKALAVNLSDLAAMGATPAWFTLALTMPEACPSWLQQFAHGLFDLANQYQMQLIGGDTTRGPWSITIQVHGFVPATLALRRRGARVGDKIYVSGTIGDAGLGLQLTAEDIDISLADKVFALNRLNKPTPRIELGLMLRQYASSAIDISDGLLADLSHILNASQVGANIYSENLPLSPALIRLSRQHAEKLALTAGDDYELCFTIPALKDTEFRSKLAISPIPFRCIGQIEAAPGLRINDVKINDVVNGYRHF